MDRSYLPWYGNIYFSVSVSDKVTWSVRRQRSEHLDYNTAISLTSHGCLRLHSSMAVLVASLMSFGSLSSGNEITIMKVSGISLMRLMIPLLLFSAVMFYLMIRFNNDILPKQITKQEFFCMIFRKRNRLSYLRQENFQTIWTEFR